MTENVGPTPGGIDGRGIDAAGFERACQQVLDHLTAVLPMGAWAITRVVDGRQTLLRVTDTAYGMTPGTAFDFEGTMCSLMVSGATPQIAPDTAAVPAYAAAAEAAGLPVRAYVGTPIVAPDGRLFGTVCGFHPTALADDVVAQEPLLALVSSLLSAVLQADTAAVELAREVERLRREADTDPLTGLLNRGAWDRFLDQEELRHRRFGDPACVVVLDLDRLKQVNDAQGHEAGAAYLRRAAGVLRSTVRAGDVLARLGGDEFGVVAVAAGVQEGADLARRLQHALDRAGVAGSVGHAPCTVVTGFPGAWKAADEAMYAEKRRRTAGAAAGPALS